MDSSDNKTLLIWALGQNGKLKLPAVRMKVDDYLEWAKGVYKEAGSILVNKNWQDPYCDLDWGLGAYNFVCEKDGDHTSGEEVITTVKRVFDGDTAQLPLGWQPMLRDIGSEWRMHDNYSLQACVLKCQSTRATMAVES
eukprot:6704269-Lingulodinium_polyedra.AAC.1